MSKAAKAKQSTVQAKVSTLQTTDATANKVVNDGKERVHGMNFSTEQMGFYLRPESFLVCKDIYAILMERFEEEMMKKRVESEFRGYSVKNSI